MRKHQFPLAAIATVATTLVIGLIISTTMYFRAQRALDALAKLEDRVEIDQVLTTAQRLYAEGRYENALAEIEAKLETQKLGPKAHLLRAQLLVETGKITDAERELQSLTEGQPEIAGAAHYLLARINLGTNPIKADQHKQIAEAMLPKTAEAYSLLAMTANTPEETLEWLSRALKLNPTHYPSLKARALAYYSLGQYQNMLEDMIALITLRPRDSHGYALRAIAYRELERFEQAIEDHNQALSLCRVTTELADIYDQRCTTYMQTGNYGAALQDAKQCVNLHPEEFRYKFNVFTALLWLKDYQQAQEQYHRIVLTSPEWHRLFQACLQKHVFDTFRSGRDIQLPADIVLKSPFFIIQEAAKCYELLAGTATNLVPYGVWSCCWSPDGKQIAYARSPSYNWNFGPPLLANGFPAIGSGYGIEILDVESRKKHLLTTFGVCPNWSPDGWLITFGDKSYPPGSGEIWVVSAQGGQPYKVADGYKPYWSADSREVFYRALPKSTICRIRVDVPDASPVHVMEIPEDYVNWSLVSPSGRYIAYEYGYEVSVVELSSNSFISKWQTPYPLYGWRLAWSPDERQLAIGSSSWYSQTGTWVLDIEKKEAHSVLPHQSINLLSCSPDGSKLLICVLDELWLADISPNTPITKVFGLTMTRDDFLTQKLQRWTQCINANTIETELYLERALTCIALQEYDRAQADLQTFASLITPSDKHLYYMMCWWGWQYCRYGLFNEGEFLMKSAAEIFPIFPDIYSLVHPIPNLISLYEKWGKPEEVEKWRAKLPVTEAVEE